MLVASSYAPTPSADLAKDDSSKGRRHNSQREFRPGYEATCPNPNTKQAAKVFQPDLR